MEKERIVDIPPKTYIRRTTSNTQYVYLILGSKRVPGKKNPQAITKLIGKVCEDNPTKMIANLSYFDYFNSNTINNYNISHISNIGSLLMFDQIAKTLKLREHLERAFPNKSKLILSVAQYIHEKGGVMHYADDWSEVTMTYVDHPLVSKDINDLFKSISEKDKMEFFKSWTKHISSDDYIAYDVTSISTDSKNMNINEYGYNRDNESKPQINLGLFLAAKKKIPVYYNQYNGSIVDKEQLPYMLKNTQDLGIKSIKLVMDKGFYSNKNLDLITQPNLNIGFIVPTLNHYKLSQSFIHKFLKEYDVIKDYIDSDMYGKWYLHKHNEGYIKIHVFYNKIKNALSEQEKIGNLKDKIEYFKELDKKGKISKEIINGYRDILDFTLQSSGRYNIEISPKIIQKTRLTSGFLVLITNDLSLSSSEILYIYRDKDPVEKAFDNFKNELDFKRLHVHKQETLNGKLFVGFIALIIRMYLISKIKDIQNELKRNNYTVLNMINEMNKIKGIKINGRFEVRVAPTKTQKIIMKHIGLDEESFEKILINVHDEYQ